MLHIAAISGYQVMVEELIQAGCDVTILDKSNRTALAYANQRKHAAIADKLVAAEEDQHKQVRCGFYW